MAEVAYSPTKAGYEGWLYDNHVGTFEEFLEDMAKLTQKERLTKAILYELEDLTPDEIRRVLEMIRGREF